MSLAKNERPRIVFMGTPEFAVAILDKLVQNKYDIVGVITSPDKPAGRGRKLNKSAIKIYAEEKGLKVLQPTNLKNEGFLSELAHLNANLQIVVAFRMLPKVVWELPMYGTFNLHASLLPNYRGAAPINWAIINGETETGVTTFFIDDKIDTGEMILQDSMAITNDDTAGTLHDKLMGKGADLVLKTVIQIEKGAVKRKKQEFSEVLRAAPKIHKDTCRIDWNKTINEVFDHIRGLSPYPAAWTTLINGKDEISVKIYEASMKKEKHNHTNGHLVFTKKEMQVAVEGGYIGLLKIQLPGKRKMETREVLNGLKLTKTALMV